jgi:hypothetical protein
VFRFDHSFWSLIRDDKDAHGDPEFAGQKEVFAKLGVQALDHAFNGVNATIIAYGALDFEPPVCVSSLGGVPE